MHRATDIPQEVTDTAAAALELHERLYPTKPVEPEEGKPAEEEGTDPNLQDPDNGEQEDNSGPKVDDEEETYKRKHDSLKGRFNKQAQELVELRQRIDSLSQQRQEPTYDEVKPTPAQLKKDEILAKLNAEYPEELIENLRALQRLEAEEVAQQYMQPIQAKAQSVEDVQYASAQQQFVSALSQKAPNWQKIWDVADEIKNGLEPSDDRVAEFLASSDPSGLYTMYELVHQYNTNWDDEKLAIVCNMYDQPVQKEQPRNFQREAMVAPSRVKSQPSINQQQDKKIWTMGEFAQFQVDCRNDKYDEATKAALWEDVQKALAEGRIRG
jgi:hypothetical protein